MEQSRCRRATSKQAIIIHLQDICHSQHNLHPQTALRCLVRIADNRCKQLSRCFIHTHLHFAFFFLLPLHLSLLLFHFLSSPPQLLSFSFFLNFLCSHFLVSFTFSPSPLSSSSLPNLLLSFHVLSFQQLSQFLTYFPFFFLLLWLSHPFIPPFSFLSYFFFSPSFLPPRFPFPLISSFLCFHILFLFYFYLAFLA